MSAPARPLSLNREDAGRSLPAQRPVPDRRRARADPLMLLGVDPGTRKCGYAVVERLGAQPLSLGIAPLDEFGARLATLRADFPIDMVAIGHGTNAAVVSAVVKDAGLPFAPVDERAATLRARPRFFADHPPRGWRRLVPRGMLLPDRPITDYAARLIAERYLRLAV